MVLSQTHSTDDTCSTPNRSVCPHPGHLSAAISVNEPPLATGQHYLPQVQQAEVRLHDRRLLALPLPHTPRGGIAPNPVCAGRMLAGWRTFSKCAMHLPSRPMATWRLTKQLSK